MKKLFLFAILCTVATLLPAQKKMYVWIDEVPIICAVAEIDSITFVDDSEPTPEPLSGEFSVSEDKKVKFSPGNLQYTFAATDGEDGTWSFAVHQYDYIGTDNVTGGYLNHGTYGDSKVGKALAQTIDLFGWSGDTGLAMWGINTSQDATAYSGDFKEWGLNIGDGATWRTLTNDEWHYLIESRANASSLYGVARINLSVSTYANGLIILPDDWETPEGITFKSGLSTGSSTDAYGLYQTFSVEQWEELEAAGAVFLPAVGRRYGLQVENVHNGGYYWSSTSCGSDNAYHFPICSFVLFPQKNDGRFRGQAVRLVQDL